MEGKEIATTLVLVGSTGNGKSATGNSILGRTAFKSECSPSGVTGTCELQQVQMKDGRKLNVIDTPGLFDSDVERDILCKEIVKCIDLAKDGIHGVLLVLSTKNRFTTEEAAALETLQMLFGEKFYNYMVVIFTGGDELETNKQTFEDYLRKSSRALQKLLRQCNDRKVLFNNKTATEAVKEKQTTELLKQIDIIIAQNGGHPYSNEMFREAQEIKLKEMEKAHAAKLEQMEKAHAAKLEQMEKAHAEQLKQLQGQMAKAHAEQLSKDIQQLQEQMAKTHAEQFFKEKEKLREQMAKEQAELFYRLTETVEDKLGKNNKKKGGDCVIM